MSLKVNLQNGKKKLFLVAFFSLLAIIALLLVQENLQKKDNPNEQVNLDINKCHEEESLVQCWEGLINSALEEQGLDFAFTVFGELYAKDTSFAASCHSFAHTLGWEAYNKYAKGQDFDLSSKTSYCGYGFYHGFMENLLLETGDPKKAKDFCSFVDEKLKGQTNDAGGACYHGIGHGSVDGSDPRAWGNPTEVIKPGIQLCEKVSSTNDQLYRCVTGAYNSLEILSGNPKYRLTTFRQDPFPFCEKQVLAYREGCYTNMIPALFGNYQNDFVKIARVIEAIPEEDDTYTIRSEVISGLFHDYYRVNFGKEDYAETGIGLCRSLSGRSHLPCVEGLSGSLMKYGEPGKEYVKTLEFCADEALALEEKDVCYNRTLSTLQIWYSKEKSSEICRQVPKGYQKYCSV
jgi:hypothetical protein